MLIRLKLMLHQGNDRFFGLVLHFTGGAEAEILLRVEGHASLVAWKHRNKAKASQGPGRSVQIDDDWRPDQEGSSSRFAAAAAERHLF
jgi:hypothetical protein